MWKYCFCASQGAALHEPVLFRGPLLDAFPYAKKLGYDGVEIHLRDAAEVDGEQLLHQSETHGIAIAAIATGLANRVDGLSLVDEDDARRRTAIERVKGHLDLAARFGCPVVIGSMRASIPSEDKRERVLDRLADALRQLSHYIVDKNCSLLLEAINRYENNYLNTSEETIQFVERVAAQKIYILLDSYHMNIEERDNEAAIYSTGKLLRHFHISENTRRHPGDGQIDFGKILSALKEIKYEGWLSMEYLPKPNELEATRKGADFARWARTEFP
jgi:sugar phosphate isomerase/epimerase